MHLTDLHVGQPREGGRVANIERELLADLKRVMTGSDPLSIAVIFFSGDIAFRGVDSEYVRASAILGRVCEQVRRCNEDLGAQHPMPILVPVPGNHDLVRPRDPGDADAIRSAFQSRAAHSPPLWQSGQAGVRALVNAAFAPYAAWLDHHPLPFPPGRRSGLLPGDLRASIARGGLSLGVVGLNSCVLHLDDVRPGDLHLDLSQLTELLGPSPSTWVEAHDFNVLVTHHPPSWLSPMARQTLDREIKPDRIFDLHLFGHDHVGAHEIDPGSAGIRHLIQGRSLFGAEEGAHPRAHGYTVGRFVVDRTERAKRVELWSRQGWYDGHGWRFGPMDERWGRWRLVIDLGAATDRAPKATPTPEIRRAAPGAYERPTGGWTRVCDGAQVGDVVAGLGTKRWLLLSAGVPPATLSSDRMEGDGPYLRTARREVTEAFVRALARRVAATADLGLLFGGQPAVTQAMAPDVLASRRADWVVLVQDEFYWFNLVEDVGVIAKSPAVVPLLLETAGQGHRLHDLRDAMARVPGLVGAVFVGGLSGVIDEFRRVGERRPEVPRLAVGLGGG
ncbi:MAG TPA: metallophosphoesterase, partial [Myxococcota bacterium]|nr:metallophosphoesterase [Myxococcota bacterium]